MTGRRGNRVVVTRARDQAGELGRLLTAAGFEPVYVPTIEIKPPETWENVDQAIRRLDSYDLIAFTSANAARMFAERLQTVQPKVDKKKMATAAIGEKTESKLKALGFRVVAVPDRPKAAEEFARTLTSRFALRGKRVLFPRAEEGRDVLKKELEKAGARVDLVIVYRTVPSFEGKTALAALLKATDVVWITFASGSAVDGFFALLGPEPAKAWLRKTGVKTAVIGDVTRSALEKYGLAADVVAAKPSMKSLVEAIVG